MQVYRAFFKIIKKNITEISIYIGVFLFFAVVLSSNGGNAQNTNFTETKCKMVFINNDKDTALVNGLKGYLNDNAKLVDIEDDTKKLQDALFYRDIEYVVRVPAGFTEGVLAGKDIQLEKTTVPDSTTGIYIDTIINKYLNTAKIYIKNLENISENQLVGYIEKDLANEINVNVNTFNSQAAKGENHVFYFNYMAYSIFAILILGVCAVMLVFNNTNIKRRNYCSPLKMRCINTQLVLANISFALLTWFIMIVTSLIMYSKYMFSLSGFLLLLNSLIFTLAVLSVSFLIANIVKSRGAMSAAANVVALGSSFISGVFVPQQFLGEKVLNIAAFTPTYWYVKANNSISDIGNFNMENLMPIFNCMFIVIAFAVAILAVTLVVIKYKRTSA